MLRDTAELEQHTAEPRPLVVVDGGAGGWIGDYPNGRLQEGTRVDWSGSRSLIRRGFLQLESEVRNLSPELSFDFMEVVVSLMECDWTA